MSEHEMVKVYELAKELGIDSISLLDKLKNLNINVKNHMSELKDEEVQIARNSLRKPVVGEKTVKKAPSKTRKKAVSVDPNSASAAPTASDSEKKHSPVLRRRVKAEGGTETVTTQTSYVPSKSAVEHSPEEVSSESGLHAAHLGQPSEEPSVYATEAETSGEGSFETAEVPQESLPEDVHSAVDMDMGATSESQALPTPVVHSMPTPNETTQETTAAKMNPSIENSSHGTAVPPSVNPSATAIAAGPAPTPPAPVKPPRPPIVLTPRPVAPRRSILKIVEATAPPPRPMIKPAPAPAAASTQQKPGVKGTTTTQDKDGFRIIKMTKENLDQMVEEEAAKKRGGGKEVDLRPEDVRFADYRKKELVFLPKKKKIPIGKEIKKTQKTVSKAQKRIIEMQDSISVQDLANQLSLKAVDVIRKLMNMGQMVTINQHLDFDTATLVANEYQYEVRNIAFKEAVFLEAKSDAAETMQPRPPVVTIMGHVDHGKTTLLDSIREANVAAGEAGGITQHIGAYTVEKNGKLITFIDTPGHEAFTVMRARGANVTDIVILVVSADDGVMPQTREALSHAQAAKVPIIVAVNKIDKPGANPEKIKQALAELNLLAEDWGGETIFVPVSALKKTNLDKLLDSILLQAEMLDLKANPDALASGVILESRVEKGRGAVVSVLISRGTLKVGDPIVSGHFVGKVKAMTNDKGQILKIATPGIAVEILGFEGLPNAGESVNATESESVARKIVDNRLDQTRAKAMAAGAGGKVSLEDLFAKIQTGSVKELNVILKADAFGSSEAIRDSLIKISTDKVKVKPILCAPGGITESDVLLASASSAIILGFNVRPETKARQVAEAEHVEIKTYSIIYELLDDVKKAMSGLLDKKKVEKFLGRAEVRQTFTVPKIGTIAGAAVIDGKILRGANVRLLRDSRIIYEGKMSSLRRFKDDAKEVATGFECGIGIENYNDLKTGDVIEAYQIDWVTPELGS